MRKTVHHTFSAFVSSLAERRLVAFAPPPDFEAAEGAARETGSDETLGERGAAVDQRGRLLGVQDVLEGTGKNEAIAARAEMHTELIAAYNSNAGNVLTAYFSSKKFNYAPRTAGLYAGKLNQRMRGIALNANRTLVIQFGVSEESGPVVLAADPFVLDRMITTLGNSKEPWELPLLGALKDYKNAQQAARNATINPGSLEALVSAKNADWIRLNPDKLETAAIKAVKADPKSIMYLSKYADLWRESPEDVYARIMREAIDAGKVDVIFYASDDWKKINTDTYHAICIEAAGRNAVRTLQLISGTEFGKFWKDTIGITDGQLSGSYADIVVLALQENPTTAYPLIHKDFVKKGKPFMALIVRSAPQAALLLFENTNTEAFSGYEFTAANGLKYRGFEAALRELSQGDTAKAVITIFGNSTLLAKVRTKCPRFYKELFDEIVKFDNDGILRFIERQGIADEDFVEKFVEAMFTNQDAWIATYPNLMRTIPDAMYKQGGVRSKLLELFKKKGQLLSFAPYEVRSDKDFVLQAVIANADAFAHVSLSMRDDADVLLAALQAEAAGNGNVHWTDIGPTLRIQLGDTPLEGAQLLERMLGLPKKKKELMPEEVTSGLDIAGVDRTDPAVVLAYLRTPGAKNRPTYIVDADPALKADPNFVAEALLIDPRYFLHLGSKAHESLSKDPKYAVWFKSVVESNLDALTAVPLSVLTPKLVVEITPKELAKRKAFFRAIPQEKLGDIEFAKEVVEKLTSRGQNAVDEFMAVLPRNVRSVLTLDFTQITPETLPNEMYDAELIKKITRVYDAANVDAAKLDTMTTWIAYALRINKNLYAEVPEDLRNDPAFIVSMLQKTYDSTLIFDNVTDFTLVNPALFDALVASSAKSVNLLNLRVALRSASPALKVQFMQNCVGHDGFPDMFAFSGNIDLIPDNALDQNVFNHIVGTYPSRELFEKAGKKPEGIGWIVTYLKINPALWSVVKTCDPALVEKVRKAMTPAELSENAQKANEGYLSRVNHRSNLEGLKNFAAWSDLLGLIEIAGAQNIVLPPHGDHGGNITVCSAYNYLAGKAQRNNGMIPQREIEQLRALILSRINVSGVTSTELEMRAPRDPNFFMQLGYIKTLKSISWSLQPNTQAWMERFIRERINAQVTALSRIADPKNLVLEIDLTLEAISGYDTWNLAEPSKQFYKTIEAQLLEMRGKKWDEILAPGRPAIQKNNPPLPKIPELTVEFTPPPSVDDPAVKGPSGAQNESENDADEEVETAEAEVTDAEAAPATEPSLLDEYARNLEVARQQLWKNVQTAVLDVSRQDPNSKTHLRTCMAALQEHLSDDQDPSRTLALLNKAPEYGPITDKDGTVFVLEWAEDLSGGHLELKKS